MWLHRLGASDCYQFWDAYVSPFLTAGRCLFNSNFVDRDHADAHLCNLGSPFHQMWKCRQVLFDMTCESHPFTSAADVRRLPVFECSTGEYTYAKFQYLSLSTCPYLSVRHFRVSPAYFPERWILRTSKNSGKLHSWSGWWQLVSLTRLIMDVLDTNMGHLFLLVVPELELLV